MNAGFAVWREPAWVDAVAGAPWEVARAVAARLGAEVEMLERQPIRPIEGGRSFAANDGPAPFHTDSQLFRGRPAHLQVLLCVRPAERGGTSLVADTHALRDEVAVADPALHDALHRVPRSFPFVFGDFVATTVAAVDDDVFFTHSPRANDPIGAALARYLTRLEHARIDLTAGDVLVVDNHRCLHGRTAFSGGARELQRLLLWLKRPWAPSPELERARQLGQSPRRSGIDAAIHAIDAGRRQRLVAEMRRGTPPGILSKQSGLPEAWLYVFRDEEHP